MGWTVGSSNPRRGKTFTPEPSRPTLLSAQPPIQCTICFSKIKEREVYYLLTSSAEVKNLLHLYDVMAWTGRALPLPYAAGDMRRGRGVPVTNKQ